MKKIISLKQLFQISCALILGISSQLYAEEQLLDKIIVVVNDDVITQTMLDDRIADFQKQLALSELSGIDPNTLKKQVLERMIKDTVQLQQAKQYGITVDDLMLNRMLERLAQSNNMTLEEFRDTIEGQGMDYARFREQTRDEVIISQLQQRIVASKINVSDQEVAQYIEQNENSDSAHVSYHLRHILIATPEAASPAEREKAKEIAESVYIKIQNGSSFVDMAIKYSDGRNALKGGDLGTRKANELPRIFVSAIQGLEPGQVSKPVSSASGFHMLELVSSSDAQIMVQQSEIRQILIRTSSEVSDAQARKKLLELTKEIENGESFAELASEFTEDPTTKITGGKLGWSSEGDYIPAFEEVAKRLPLNKISKPFKSQFGWHIIEVLDRRQHNQGKTNKENQARNAITKRKMDEEIRLWSRRTRDEAFVEFIDE